MEHNYTTNPAIKLLCDKIEAGSTEKEVQDLHETLLWTVFPADGLWVNHTKYKTGHTEPDSRVTKLVQYTHSWGLVDVLVGELKRLREKPRLENFDTVANKQLKQHLAQSRNPVGSTLRGYVGIGLHIKFYWRVIPEGELLRDDSAPLHIEHDAALIQLEFNGLKAGFQSAASAPYSAVPEAASTSDATVPEAARTSDGARKYTRTWSSDYGRYYRTYGDGSSEWEPEQGGGSSTNQDRGKGKGKEKARH